MMKHTLLLLFLCSSVWAGAQERLVTVSVEKETDKEITFYADNNSHIPHSVVLVFDRLENTITASVGIEYTKVVKSGRNKLITLKASDPASEIAYSYNYKSYKGDVVSIPDTNYVYLLPVLEDKRVKVSPMTSMEKMLRQDKPTRIVGLAFGTHEGDTVVASRGGLVIDTQDDITAANGNNKAYSSSENYVEIYHKDGTIARYRLFKNNGVFVEPGETVIPGQPLGVIGGQDYQYGSHLHFLLSTYYKKDYHTIIPSFYLEDGVIDKPDFKKQYVSQHPEDIIMREMSKKEKKKYLGKK